MHVRHASRVVAPRRPGIKRTPNANRSAINVLVHGRRRTSRPQGARRAIVATTAHEVQPGSMRNTVARRFCLRNDTKLSFEGLIEPMFHHYKIGTLKFYFLCYLFLIGRARG